MDEEYDVIVLGTGLKECILSGLMSTDKKKVLHMDRNSYYGGECASLTPLTELFDHFKRPFPGGEKYGRLRDWNVDLIPKFLMANGKLVQLLLYTGVTRYLEFKSLEGSYVWKNTNFGGKLHKVPSNEREALSSSLMGLFEKRRFKGLLQYCQDFNFEKPLKNEEFDPNKKTARELYAKFKVDENTQDFTGHAIALFLNENYLESKASELIKRIQLYSGSLARYGRSPYLYPLYGLGELPQGFARLSAIYGGTYMLNKTVDELVMEDGKVVGVRSGDEVAKTKMVICDPSYAPHKVKKTGKVVRAICILTSKLDGVDNCESLQIILPQHQLKRKNDIYIGVLSGQLFVAPKGNFYLGIVSTTVETSNPEAELQVGIDILNGKNNNISDKFVTVADLLEPVDDGTADNIFVSTSYDATSHFQTTCEDVIDIYKRATGKDIDLSNLPHLAQDEEQQQCAQ